MLNYINVKNITPHPDNPRRELGDLSELTESIRINGIFQNLTVVPWVSKFTGQLGDNGSTKDDYTVIIGHRRLAAAKAAGLTEVPCIVADMTPSEQVQTMLLENMQRCDLTPYEQACGFQVMFDMGETVNTISEKTGFSQTTIRHRMEMAKLDKKTLEQTAKKGATIADYIELEKIKDIDTRNSVLESIGTRNFNIKLSIAIDEQRSAAGRIKWEEVLSSFATLTDEQYGPNGTEYADYINYGNDAEDYKFPEDSETTQYYYKLGKFSGTIYRTREKNSPVENEISEAEKKRRDRVAQMEALTERMYNLRIDFVKNFRNAKKHLTDIVDCNAQLIIDDIHGYGASTLLLELLNIAEAECTDDDEQDELEVLREHNEVAEAVQKEPERVLFLSVYCCLNDSSSERYHNRYYGHYCDNDLLNLIYEFLIKLGYEMSDEEKQMQDGTHALFNEEETT